MRLAFVLPWLSRTGGNKISLSLAEELVDQGDEVELFAHTMNVSALAELPKFIPKVPIHYLKTTSKQFRVHLDPIVWNAASRRDKELALLIGRSHKEHPFNAVVLFANEGRTLARYLRRTLKGDTPLLGWCIMELVDHSFLLRRERDLGWFRSLGLPLYPFAHELWRGAYHDQDFILANSLWTSDLLEYLYGITCYDVVISLPQGAFFRDFPQRGPGYLAVPTVSLGPRESGLLANLAEFGLPLIAYGPKPPDPSISIPYRGFLSESGMRDLIAGATATLFLFDYEALGLVPLESLAAGTPVITLAKQGPYRTLFGNPDVHFGRNIDEIRRLCLQALESPPNEEVRLRARRSVETYSSSNAALRFRAQLSRLLSRPS